MKYFHRLFLVILVFILYHSSFIIPALAQGEISSSQNVTYQVFENGKTKVRHDVELTNLTTNYYASEYSLFLGFTDLQNISSSDSQGPLQLNVTTKENGTDIHLAFNDQVVGKGKILAFSISYETDEVAAKNGRIWEINIPRIKDIPGLADYTTTLLVPPSFGKATYIKPKLVSKAISASGLVFEKNDVLRGISVVFGDYQLFDFALTYHLKNSRLYPIVTEIALPPATASQDVLLEKLEPEPLTVYQDKDGNWLAKYRLEGGGRLDVKALGKAKIFHVPQKDVPSQTEYLDEYLKPQKYWEVHDPKIIEKAKELATPKAMYDYVVATLTYDYDRIEKNVPRAGAASALGNPSSAICMEFTDLFIALARAAGIPAREVNGFAYTGNARLRPLSLVRDILHAWPEYYDKEKGVWIGVDPTWGNTSGVEYFDILDFNHFAFVIKGQDSEYPSPAGSYKESEDLEKKDVEVTFAKDDQFVERRSVSIETDLPEKIVAGFSKKGRLFLRNSGNKVLYGGEVLLNASKMFPETQNIAFTTIPPFGNSVLPATFKSTSYFDHFKTTVKAKVGSEELSQEIQVLPIYLVYLPVLGGGTGVALLLFVAFKTWRVRVQGLKKSNSLRGQSQQPQGPGVKLPSKKG